MEALILILCFICIAFLLYEAYKQRQLRLKAYLLSTHNDLLLVLLEQEKPHVSKIFTLNQSKTAFIYTASYELKNSFKKRKTLIKARHISKMEENLIISLVSRAYSIAFDKSELIRNMKRGTTIYLINLRSYGRNTEDSQ